MIKRLLLSITILSVAFVSNAQHQHTEKCGAAIQLERDLKDSENRAKYEAFQESIQRYTNDPRVAVERDANGTRIIPVVFHILHDGGNENIPIANVEKQMEVLNEDYRRLNEDTVNMPERFRGDTEYTSLVFTSDAIEDFLDDSAYVRLNTRYGESIAFHFFNGVDSIADTLQYEFDRIVEVSYPSNPDTADLAQVLTDSINSIDGLIASYEHNNVTADAPNFTVDGNEVSSLSYTSEHTYTTSWNGTDTDTTYSDTLMVVLYEDSGDPLLPTDTLFVFDASITYDVFDGAGSVIGTNSFVEEGNLTLSFTEVIVEYGEHRVEIMTDGLGYVNDVLLSNLWHITSNISQQGTYIPADCNIEFRLATKDPLGNCTDGIVRVFTSKTNDANNGTGFKGVSYWNSHQYLNVWVVKNIDFDTGQGGQTLGYAQFPASGLPSTDGITVRSDNINESYRRGRTATHEVGHWLSLIHIWGDSQCGSDDVLDTPTHFGPNFNVCGNNPDPQVNPIPQPPSVPFNTTEWHVPAYNETACGPDQPDGEMFMNYMDYSNDACQNLFTLGQKARMDFTLHGDGSDPGIRSYLISQENLELTGVADPYTQPDCAPISSFYFDQNGDFATQIMICQGEEVDFEETAYNGSVDDFSWTFEGGNPASSTNANPNGIQYDTPGRYDVTLEVSNAVGSDSQTAEEMVIVSSTAAQYQSNWGYVDSYWNEQDFLNDYVVFNQDGTDNKWEWYFGEEGGSTGWESMRMFNLDNGFSEIDEIVSPSYNLSAISNPTLQFRYAGAALDNTPDDQLRIMASDDCGESWSTRETMSGFDLVNNGLVPESFRPDDNTVWTDVSVGLGSFASKPNVRIKFRWVSGRRSNNFYIDDLTISGAGIGMEDLERQIDLNVAPNPTSNLTTVTMSLPEASKVRMELVDILGKNVTPMFDREMSNGTHKFDVDLSTRATGIYYLRIFVDNDMVVKKVVKH